MTQVYLATREQLEAGGYSSGYLGCRRGRGYYVHPKLAELSGIPMGIYLNGANLNDEDVLWVLWHENIHAVLDENGLHHASRMMDTAHLFCSTCAQDGQGDGHLRRIPTDPNTVPRLASLPDKSPETYRQVLGRLVGRFFWRVWDKLTGIPDSSSILTWEAGDDELDCRRG